MTADYSVFHLDYNDLHYKVELILTGVDFLYFLFPLSVLPPFGRFLTEEQRQSTKGKEVKEASFGHRLPSVSGIFDTRQSSFFDPRMSIFLLFVEFIIMSLI